MTISQTHITLNHKDIRQVDRDRIVAFFANLLQQVNNPNAYLRLEVYTFANVYGEETLYLTYADGKFVLAFKKENKQHEVESVDTIIEFAKEVFTNGWMLEFVEFQNK